MLNFLKKLFAKEEVQEEKVPLNELNNWVDQKTKTIFDGLNVKINETIEKINDEKAKVTENLKTLEDAQLQNPKIPERVKTIMEGNRAGFIKKVSFFSDKIDLKYNDYNELIEKSKNIENEINALGKGTAKSYQVLGEFFAREAGNIAANIKNIENYSKEIKDTVNNSKITNVDKIKKSVSEIENKIRLKKQHSSELENNKNDLQNNKNKKSEIENKINSTKSSEDYKNYERLLEEKEKISLELNNIENTLFHDFSVLEKSLKKYAKIAFENEKLILEYLGNPTLTLIKDSELVIVKILGNLKNAIEKNEFELDDRKKEKSLAKINDADSVYFTKMKDDFAIAKKKSNDIKSGIESNNSKKEMDSLKAELMNIDQTVQNDNNKILNLNNELEKINVDKLKENLVNEIENIVNVKITVL
tara:strand:- start:15457 stop:16710 length:1254 start_codon:yes stop_codon:yes gene_type:complete